ncbi:trypsin-like serine peptidase [Mycobacterium servetii]|uniref:Serine protease n=1 Tax=Mycobacterium servetii TaxID=3237418 RepID=A0ABV4C463_9MYCO
MRSALRMLCPVVGLATLLTACGRPADHAAAPRVPTQAASKPVERLSKPQNAALAAPVDPDMRVGPIFLDGGTLHVCTGSVVHSASGNLVMTAAHCLAGGSQISFAPGFAGDAAPTDLWTADAVYLDPRWTAAKDPRADYAVIRVSGPAAESVESHVGLALTLGQAPSPGSHVTVLGYPSGVGGSPVACQASAEINENGYPSVVCEGLVDGTSGGPWVSGTTITGLTGGFERGGCAENVSYSAPFDQHVAQLLARAEAGGPGDTVPNGLDDSC